MIGALAAESIQLDLQYDAGVLARLNTGSWKHDPATSYSQSSVRTMDIPLLDSLSVGADPCTC